MLMSQISKRFELLGGKVEVVFYDIDPSIGETFFEMVEDEGLRLQRIFNIFDPKSEISLLNKKRAMCVSAELREVLAMSIPYCKLTGGAYDVTLGRAILQRKLGRPAIDVNCSYRDIEMKDDVVFLKDEDAALDLGSIAKGYIGDRLAAYVQELGIESAFIDLRGDLVAFGKYSEEVSVQHPRKEEERIFSFELRDAAVATSGDYKQYYGSFDESHVLGGRDFISATVVAENLAEADIIATCLMVVGKEKLDLFSKSKYMVIDKDLNIIMSEKFKNEVS